MWLLTGVRTGKTWIFHSGQRPKTLLAYISINVTRGCRLRYPMTWRTLRLVYICQPFLATSRFLHDAGITFLWNVVNILYYSITHHIPEDNNRYSHCLENVHMLHTVHLTCCTRISFCLCIAARSKEELWWWSVVILYRSHNKWPLVF